MKVYVAKRELDYEGFAIIGIYSNYEAAQAACEADREAHPSLEWDVAEFELDPPPGAAT
jgi:hypothetical protein